MSMGKCIICGFDGLLGGTYDEPDLMICLECFLDAKHRRLMMGWKDAMGSSESTGMQDHVRIKANETVRLHILLEQGEEPVSFWSHFITGAKRSVICPGKDVCPACSAGIDARRRHAMNVYDYTTESVKILEQGNTVIQQLKMIYDQYGSLDTIDVSIMRTGDGKNNTQYMVMPVPLTAPFQLVGEKYDIQELKMPTSVEEITKLIGGATTAPPHTQAQPVQQVVQQTAASMPQAPQATTQAEPTAGVVTFGKYKGKTLEAIFDIDPSYVEWCAKNIKNVDIKAKAQALVNMVEGTQEDTPPPAEESAEASAEKSALMQKAYDIINGPELRGKMNIVIEAMKKATATAQLPNGKTLLADYTEDELTTLLEVL